MSVEQNVIDTLTKLVAHEKSARDIGSLREAEAFAGKIQSLLSKYKLEMSDVELLQRQNEDIADTLVIPEEVGLRTEHMRIAWQFELAKGVAESNNCNILGCGYSNHLFFVGRRSDRELCVALFRHLAGMALRMADQSAEERNNTPFSLRFRSSLRSGLPAGMGDDAEYKRSFCTGFAKSIAERLRQEWLAAKAEKERAEHGGCNALVMIKKDEEAIQGFIGKEFPDPNAQAENNRRARSDANQPFDMQGFMDGKTVGRGVALTPHTLKGDSES